MYVFVCVTPELSTKRRMSVMTRTVEAALQALSAVDGPGGTAARALMAVGTAVLAASGAPLVWTLGALVITIT
jgi:hypothetical protein